MITIERTKGFGDILAATAVAMHLKKQGHKIRFQTNELCFQVLKGNPYIDEIATPGQRPDIDLGDIHEAQKRFHLQECYAQIARRKYPGEYPLIDPVVGLSIEELTKFEKRLLEHPRPWVSFCPGSWQGMNRTVDRKVWHAVFDEFKEATFFKPTQDIIGGRCTYVGDGTFRGMMSVLARSDLLITVDSGPMHVGAALGIPMVIIEQAWPIALRIAPGAKFTRIKAPVPCAPCREHVCPIKGVDTAKPPCQILDSKVIVKAARKMLPNFYPQ